MKLGASELKDQILTILNIFLPILPIMVDSGYASRKFRGFALDEFDCLSCSKFDMSCQFRDILRVLEFTGQIPTELRIVCGGSGPTQGILLSVGLKCS